MLGVGCPSLPVGVLLLSSQSALQSGDEIMDGDVLLLLLGPRLVLNACGPQPDPKVEGEDHVRRWPALQESDLAHALRLASSSGSQPPAPSQARRR